VNRIYTSATAAMLKVAEICLDDMVPEVAFRFGGLEPSIQELIYESVDMVLGGGPRSSQLLKHALAGLQVVEERAPVDRQWLLPASYTANNVFPVTRREAEVALEPQARRLAESLHRALSQGKGSAIRQYHNVLKTVSFHAQGIGTGFRPGQTISNAARVAAALTAVRLRNASSYQVGLLVGDFSGIQRYVMGGLEGGHRGSARRIRARSFLLSQVNEVVSHHVAHAFGVPIGNIVLSTAGKFDILIPWDDSVEGRMDELRRELAEDFMERFQGDLYLALACQPMPLDFRDSFAASVQAVNRKLDLEKLARLGPVLRPEARWRDDFSIGHDPGEGEELCEACLRQPGVTRSNGVVWCDDCHAEYRLGQLLPNATSVAYYRGSDAPGFPLVLDYRVLPLAEGEVVPGKPYLVVQVNSSELGFSEFPELGTVVANHIPTENGQALDFDALADRAEGRALLGYLKADVDDLGLAFIAGGLESETGEVAVFELHNNLSRLLELFFSSWLHRHLEEHHPNCYTVFAGGDDLFLIGPWNEVSELAFDLNDEFSRLSSHNPNLHLSAGLHYTKPHEPFARAAAAAETALHAAKSETGLDTKDVRNQVAMFERVLGWDNAVAAYAEGNRLLEWLEGGHLSSGTLWRLYRAGLQYEQFRKTNRGLGFAPALYATIARHLPSQSEADSSERQVLEWATSLTRFGTPAPLERLPVAVQVAYNKLRD